MLKLKTEFTEKQIVSDTYITSTESSRPCLKIVIVNTFPFQLEIAVRFVDFVKAISYSCTDALEHISDIT